MNLLPCKCGHNIAVHYRQGCFARVEGNVTCPCEEFQDKRFIALLEYAKAEEALYGEHWQITPESEQLAKQRRAALALCVEPEAEI